MSDPVDYELVDRLAIITIHNPPVNALSQPVREGLLDAVQRLQSDESAEIALLVGKGRLFIGGADISEFGKAPKAPSLPEVVNAIERSDKPVVAAIHGMALGGGLEVALGAHYRVAVVGAKLGLPEVKLGLIPGAGGTQRLPRLVGAETALSMITGGKPVSAEAALDTGLLDHVADGDDAREVGIAEARRFLDEGKQMQRTGERATPDANGEVFETWRKKLGKKIGGEIAPLSAVDAIEAATRLSIDEGLAEERRLFKELMESPQREGLIHAFFAERKVAKLPEIEEVEAREITHVGIVGGGTMGSGIATAAVLNGLSVTLIEQDTDAADKARETIADNLDAAIERGKLDKAGRERILDDKLGTVTDFDALSAVDLVIEAVFEDMEVKQEVFRRIDKVARSGAILATNTSYLDINEIAAATERPGDVIGLHFFSPAHVMKLLEIVVARETEPEVTASAFAFAKTLGKTAVRAGVCDGFIGNRILSQYRTAADHMVLDGASPYQVDRAVTDFGFAMGPYQTADLAGLDIGYATRQRKAQQGEPRARNPDYADVLYHKGRLGRKSGRGYYIYDEQSPKGREDPEVEDIVAEARAEAGITPVKFKDEEIVRRYLAAMINEGAQVVDDGIAERPLDVDVTLLYGYGFPRWRGGPMKYADMQGIDTILNDIRRFAEDDPHFWTPAPLLQRLADEQRQFESLNQTDANDSSSRTD